MLAEESPSPSSEYYALTARLTPESLAGAELPHPQGPTARFLVAELTGVEDQSHTFIMETIIAVPESQNVPQRLNIEEQHQPGVNDSMTGAMKPPAAPVTAWACARSGASSTATAASAAAASAHAWRSKGFVLLITVGSSW